MWRQMLRVKRNVTSSVVGATQMSRPVRSRWLCCRKQTGKHSSVRARCQYVRKENKTANAFTQQQHEANNTRSAAAGVLRDLRTPVCAKPKPRKNHKWWHTRGEGKPQWGRATTTTWQVTQTKSGYGCARYAGECRRRNRVFVGKVALLLCARQRRCEKWAARFVQQRATRQTMARHAAVAARAPR